MAGGSNQRNKQDYSPGIVHFCPEANLLCAGHAADPHNTWLSLNREITNQVFNRANSCLANSFLTAAAIFPVDLLINVWRLGFHASLGQRDSWLLIAVASVGPILACLRASAEPLPFTSASKNSLTFLESCGFGILCSSGLRWLHRRSNECYTGWNEGVESSQRGWGERWERKSQQLDWLRLPQNHSPKNLCLVISLTCSWKPPVCPVKYSVIHVPYDIFLKTRHVWVCFCIVLVHMVTTETWAPKTVADTLPKGLWHPGSLSNGVTGNGHTRWRLYCGFIKLLCCNC